MCDKYNGWTNWETWVVNLHFGNVFVEDADLVYAESSNADEATLRLADIIKESIQEQIDFEVDLRNATLATEFITQSLKAVDYYEIAGHYIYDLED